MTDRCCFEVPNRLSAEWNQDYLKSILNKKWSVFSRYYPSCHRNNLSRDFPVVLWKVADAGKDDLNVYVFVGG